jgi:hypothetical protein
LDLEGPFALSNCDNTLVYRRPQQLQSAYWYLRNLDKQAKKAAPPSTDENSKARGAHGFLPGLARVVKMG